MADKPFKFICGDDDYLVSEQGREWFVEQSKDVMDDLSKEVVDGRAGNVAEVEQAINRFTSAVQTLSLFGERKVVWLKDVNFMANTQTGNAQGTLDLVDNLKVMQDHHVYNIPLSIVDQHLRVEQPLLSENASFGYASFVNASF